MCCGLLAMSLSTICAGATAADTAQDIAQHAVQDAAQNAADAAGPATQRPAAAQEAHEPGTTAVQTPRCLPQGNGYLRARISGSIQAELEWDNEGMLCTGAARPAGKGIRIRFSRPGIAAGDAALEAQRGAEDAPRDKHDRDGKVEAGALAGADAAHELVLVFGITGLREGQSARAVPVNLTVIREGRGQFYSTQGDDKCLLDDVTQTPIIGLPRRSRSYRIVARGFCTEPARAVRGPGAILLSRFDFAGQVDFETEDAEDELYAAMPDD